MNSINTISSLMVRSFITKILIGLLPIFIFSCESEENTNPALITEEVIYLSGERVRIMARVVTNQEINATDHGFYIGENENFSTPIIVSLGQKATPGRFIGEHAGLKTESTYFAKAFLTINGSQTFSNTISFQTLSTNLFDIVPNNGKAGTIVEIFGKNFTSDTRVFFGSNEAEVIGISFESKIRVRVPLASGSSLESVKIISQNKEIESSLTFEYTSGIYRRIEGTFPVPKLYDNIHFQINDNFYVGLGTGVNPSLLNPKIWRYEHSAKDWEETSYQGGGRDRAFSAGSYFGGGTVSNLISLDLWKVEQGNFLQLPNLPFQMVNSIAFILNHTLYVVGGSIGSGRQIYRYDAVTGNWELKGVLPFGVRKNNTFHFGTGEKHFFIDHETKEIFSFNGNHDDISKVGNYPGALTEERGFAVILNNKAYMGLSARSNKVYELDLTDLSWKEKNEYPGITIAETIGVFTKGDLIYLLRSPARASSQVIEFWEFDPMGF